MDSAAAWSDETHVLALVADAVQFGNWQRAGGKGERPKPLTRPGAKTAEQMRQASAARRMARHQARQRRRREGGAG